MRTSDYDAFDSEIKAKPIVRCINKNTQSAIKLGSLNHTINIHDIANLFKSEGLETSKIVLDIKYPDTLKLTVKNAIVIMKSQEDAELAI